MILQRYPKALTFARKGLLLIYFNKVFPIKWLRAGYDGKKIMLIYLGDSSQPGAGLSAHQKRIRLIKIEKRRQR